MTKDDLNAILARNKHIAIDENQTASSVLRKTYQSQRKNALVRKVSRTEEGVARPVVRFTGYRVRPADPDGYPRSCKDLIDGLRHAKLIPGDEIWKIILQTEQVKVSKKSDERTEIEIEIS